MKVVAVGVYVPDHYYYVARLPRAGESLEAHGVDRSHGGKAANQAVAAARLGARAGFVGVVGRDASGHDGIQALRGYGVDTSGVRTHPDLPTGSSCIVLDPSGSQLVLTYAGAGADLDAQEALGAVLRHDPAVVLLQGELPTDVTLTLARAVAQRCEATIVLDPSPAEGFVGRRLDGIDVLTPNEHEATVLTGQSRPRAADVAEATGTATVLLTRGARGVEVLEGGVSNRIPGVAVEAVDTTGAGDAFNGALAAALAAGGDLTGAARSATIAAAISVTRSFCMPSFATANELADATRAPH